MNETPEPIEIPESSTDHAATEEVVVESDEPSNLAFALLSLALVALVGASVFFVGKLVDSNEETQAAQDRADEQLENFEAPALTTETSPETLPLADPVAPVETAPSEPPADEANQGSDANPGLSESQVTYSDVPAGEISIAFVNRTPGDDYGRVGYINREGERNQTELQCDRLDAVSYTHLTLPTTPYV